MNAAAPLRIPSSSSGRTLSLSAWCIVAAFGTYFCSYAYRKPFTAATYEGVALGWYSFKELLVIAQTLGYMLSKFIGIKVIAEMRPERRVIGIGVIGVAQVALLLFAVVPPPYNLVCLFLNGLPLGMVFCLILGFLEGRQQTEALTAGLCASFVLASGVCKSVGSYLLKWGSALYWMPFLSGLVFAGPLLFFVWMLSRIPPPSAIDLATRQARVPMNAADRWQFFRGYAFGLVPLLGFFVLCTVLRSLRDDFAAEIWQGLGYGKLDPDLFTQSEIMVVMVVVICNGATILVRNNRVALFGSLGICLVGFLLILVALVGLNGGWINGFLFVVLGGVGLYLPYIAVHTTIFERMMAMSRDRGNIGYLMSLADSFGYLGYVVILLLAPRLQKMHGQFLQTFEATAWTVALVSLVLLAAATVFFSRHLPVAVSSASPTPQPWTEPRLAESSGSATTI